MIKSYINLGLKQSLFTTGTATEKFQIFKITVTTRKQK